MDPCCCTDMRVSSNSFTCRDKVSVLRSMAISAVMCDSRILLISTIGSLSSPSSVNAAIEPAGRGGGKG